MNTPDAGELPASAGRFPERPRLGIRHLLLWTACSAFYLAAYQGLFPRDDRIHTLLDALYSVSGGTFLMGVLLWLTYRLRKVRFPSSEGEILWVILGILVLAELARIPTYDHVYADAGGDAGDGGLVLLITATITSSILYLTAWVWLLIALFHTRKRLWRALFGVTLAVPILQGMGCCQGWYGQIYGFYSAAWIVYLIFSGSITAALIWQDWRQRPRPPWTHWAGVLCCGWQSAVGLVNVIVNWIAYVAYVASGM